MKLNIHSFNKKISNYILTRNKNGGYLNMERKIKNSTKLSTRQMAIVGMLSGISILLGITGLGFIPIPPINATIMHVPVIIGAIIEGPVVGATIGLIFGIFSIIRADR